MPELPEVETVSRALNRFVLGRTIIAVNSYVPKLRYKVDLKQFADRLPTKILVIRRRAKYIIMECDNDLALLTHLGMTGSWRLESIHERRQKHDHIEFVLEDQEVLRYNDPRRFGFIEVIPQPDQDSDPMQLPRLAPEPLTEDFNIQWLANACKTKNKPIKNLIMDNAHVVGVGNIYASEALFRSGINPQKPANKISRSRLKRLLAAIKDVLQEAIEAGGTTIINFASLNSQEGYFARELNVYDRFGELCTKCQRGRIQRITMAGRSTYFCAVCQR